MSEPKGYWIVHMDVTDPEAYKAYVAANGPAIAAFDGKFLTRGGTSEVKEGALRARHVVLEFPSYKAATDCYASEAYQAALKLRSNASAGDLVIVEGYNGPHPGE
ncbi:DUF1330 domain-containing protein [Tepidamorphus sp. 3E244]|uniref:DUF1330 domain-containing protein n=1 Tax=Tepidamorphus sp. 3E244 TaxID=3385498 RepID=UPI0038FD2609